MLWAVSLHHRYEYEQKNCEPYSSGHSDPVADSDGDTGEDQTESNHRGNEAPNKDRVAVHGQNTTPDESLDVRLTPRTGAPPMSGTDGSSDGGFVGEMRAAIAT